MKRITKEPGLDPQAKKTAAVMDNPKSTPQQKLAAALAEQATGRGTWSADLEAE